MFDTTLKKAIAGLVALVLVLGVILLLKRKPSDPEAEIRAALQRAAEAAERQDVGGVMEIVSERFKGRGGMDHAEARRYVFAALRMGAWRRVFLIRTTVHLDGDRAADVKTHAILARGEKVEKPEDVVPTNAETLRFDLRFEKEDGKWRTVSGEYERVNWP